MSLQAVFILMFRTHMEKKPDILAFLQGKTSTEKFQAHPDILSQLDTIGMACFPGFKMGLMREDHWLDTCKHGLWLKQMMSIPNSQMAQWVLPRAEALFADSDPALSAEVRAWREGIALASLVLQLLGIVIGCGILLTIAVYEETLLDAM